MDIISEIGQAHDGSLGFAHSYIDALKDTGVNSVKFQTHIAHAESSSFENNFHTLIKLDLIIGKGWNLLKMNGLD